MIKSIQKAINILTLLSDSPEQPITLTVIADKLKLSRATTAHILETLSNSLLVEHVSRKDGYRLGAETFMLTRYGRYQESLVAICAPVIKWLNRKTDASVVLSVICDGVKYIVIHIDSNRQIDFTHSGIKKGTVDTTATGQLLMAYMNVDQLNRTFYRSLKNGLRVSPEKQAQMRLHFEKIRNNGYAYVYNETEESHSYAFRVNEDNKTVAAIGVFFYNDRNTPEYRNNVIKFGRIASNEINRRLSFRKDGFTQT